MADIFEADHDEGGLWLVFDIDDVHGRITLDGIVRVNLHDHAAALSLARFVEEHVLPGIQEYERHQAAFIAGYGPNGEAPTWGETPHERAVYLGYASPLDPDEALRDRADIDRKRAKGE